MNLPVKVKMLLTSKRYPFLKQGKLYQIPEPRALELFKGDEAEAALGELDYEVADVKGESSFSASSSKKQSAKKEDEPKKTSLYIDDNYMYEQIKKNGNFYFLRYEFATGEIVESETIEGDEPIYPITDEEAKRDFIKLPSGVCEYETEDNLIQLLTKHIIKYLDVPEEYVKIAVLNIMKSWVFQRFHSINYLRVRGEPGTGKSRFLDTVGHLHYKVIATTGATTVAPIFRLINKWQGSLSIDEADIAQGDETNDMIKIINQGFEKDKPVMRCNTEDNSIIDFFDVYCPKVLSTRRQFKDVATETRCLTHIMTSTSRKDIPSSLNEEYARETERLRNMLLLWRFRKYKGINPDIGEKLNWDGIEPRLKQVNVGFVALFSEDETYLEKFMDYVRSIQKEIRQERSMTPEGLIMQSILDLLINDQLITADGIISKANLTDDRGNKWKPQKLAPYMKTLGFMPAKKKRNGDTIEKVYYPDATLLDSLFTKFIPNEDLADSYKEFKEQSKRVLANFNHTYHYLFVSLFPCVPSLMGGGVPEPQSGCSPVNEKCDGHLKTGHTETQGNRMLEKLTFEGTLVETTPGTFKRVI